MAREGRSLPTGPLGWFGFMAKFIYGIPAALVSTVILGSALGVVTVGGIVSSKLIEGRNTSGYDSKSKDPIWEKASKNIASLLSKSWGNMAFGPYRDIGGYIGEQNRAAESKKGFGRAGDEKDYDKDNALAKERGARAHDKSLKSYSETVARRVDDSRDPSKPSSSPNPNVWERLFGNGRNGPPPPSIGA